MFCLSPVYLSIKILREQRKKIFLTRTIRNGKKILANSVSTINLKICGSNSYNCTKRTNEKCMRDMKFRIYNSVSVFSFLVRVCFCE